MPNTKKTVTALPGNAAATLSHETAKKITYFKIPLKGKKKEKLAELSLFMRLQVSFLIQAIEADIAGPDNDEVMAAVYLYLEAKTTHHYILNNIR